MTNSRKLDECSKYSNNKRLLLLVFKRGSVAASAILLVGIAGGAWRLWDFIQKELAPLASSNLTSTLNRPVKLGGVKGFSFSGVRFGASAIPTTSTDPDRATIESVEVGFDPLQLLFHRNLKLDVTLVNADVYIEQDTQGRWLTTTIKQGKPGPIKTDLDKIRFRNGKLTLLSRKIEARPTPVTIAQIDGTTQLLEKNRLIRFDLEGRPINGGNFSLAGDLRIKGGNIKEAKLKIQGRDLLAADITRIIRLPLTFAAGRAKGNLKIHLRQEEPSLIDGTASIQGVTAQIPRMPLPFVNAQGNFSFQGTETRLDDVSGGYGKIPLVAQGTIDQKTGYKLAAVVPMVTVENAQETLKIKSPVPLAGELKADLQLVGAITKPLLLGTVTTLKPAQIDRVDFENIRSQFEFSPSLSVVTLRNIQGKPKLGGEVTGSGTVKLGQEAQLNFNLAAKNVPGDAIALIYDIKPTFQINPLSATAQLTGSPGNVQTVLQFQAPQATYPATGEVVVAPDSKLSFRNVVLSVKGGRVQAYGNLANQRFSAVAEVKGVQIEPFVDRKQLENVSLKGAEFNGSLIMKGTSAPFKLQTIDTKDGGVKIGGGTVAVSNIQLQEQDFSAQLVANGVRLSQILKQYPPVLRAPLAGTFQIAGNRDNLSLKTLQGTGEARLAVGGGIVTAKNIQLTNGVYQAKLLVNDANVQELAQIPKQIQGQLTGDFNVAGTVDSFQLPAIQATGQARLAVGKGIITASNIQLANGIYQTQLQTNNVPLQRLIQIPRQFYGNLNGQFNVAGSVESFKPETVQAVGQGRLNVDNGGTITASNIQLANGRYQAALDTFGLPLNQFSQQLRGGLNGKLQVAGTTGSFNIANIQAAGEVQLTQGIAGIEEPITAVVGWNGDKLNVERATARDLNAAGEITVKSTTANVPEITALNLNVQAQNYSLRTLNNLPPSLTLRGTADFSGQLTGKPIAPNLVGQIRLRDLTVNKFAFEPALSGNIQSLPGRGLNLDVLGSQDKITLNLDGNNRPNSFLVKWQQALAIGQSQGDNLAVKVENFPLAALNLTPPQNPLLGGGTITGSLTGDVLVNQKTLASATGNVAIAKPEVGRIKGDRLLFEFGYDKGIVTVAKSEFFKGLSRYAFAGSFSQTGKSPQVKGNLNVDRGNIQDILTALQLFDLQDFRRSMTTPTYGSAADLNTESVGLLNQPKIVQIERYYEIQALLDQQQQKRRDASPVPDLADLKGLFNGSIDVDTATPNGLFAKFSLNGQNFAWGREDEPDRYFHAEQIIADGSFENGILRFLPLRIESKKRLFAFIGNIGGDEQSGQLRVNNFPLKFLQNFVKLPIGLTGNLNGTATLAGNIANPKAKGELQIINGTLNQKGIESASASFSYGDGRLNFGSSVSVSGPQPVSIDGSIPYQLPFASTAPNSNQIALNVNVKNEGLALLNLFTNQVAFEQGEGEVKLTVRGTRQEPIVNGIAILNNAIFSAQALPGKLTDVAGKAQFDFDRIVVESLEGKFSRGKIQAAGEIPIFNNQEAEIKNPLSVSLDQLALNLKGIYQGGASGKLQITGAALNPIIGGNIKLENGQVLLSETNSTTPLKRETKPLVKQLNPEMGNAMTRFNNLELELGNNIQITRPPILNFLATGSLNVNGSLNDLLPTGTIKLEQGGVNLFTTQFKLARNYEHTATFSQGLDPDLDIKLFARVLSAIRSIDLGRRKSGIESDRLEGLAALETVRVEASVKGPASKLNENLELTSSPTRSQPEIVALLGGGFVDTQGRGDSTLGLINIAGSAVLSNFQGTFSQIANAFGLSDFRIFPTIISADLEAGRGSSSLELAAEAGIDISPRLSVSTIKILTADDAAQWGLNYRINNEFRFRTSTNLFDDSRAVLEFERRF